jgi:hypothetical protein
LRHNDPAFTGFGLTFGGFACFHVAGIVAEKTKDTSRHGHRHPDETQRHYTGRQKRHGELTAVLASGFSPDGGLKTKPPEMVDPMPGGDHPDEFHIADKTNSLTKKD